MTQPQASEVELLRREVQQLRRDVMFLQQLLHQVRSEFNSVKKQ